MTDDLTALGAGLGDAAGGALAARAAEPDAGGAARGGTGHFAEAACLNCGTALVGAHCHGCGQPAHVHRTLGAFFHDLLHGVFHFEGKIWRTLPLLAWRPGELTRDYIDGRRARYVSPVALFLFTVFVGFAAFNLAGSHAPDGVRVQGPAQAAVSLRKTEEAIAAAEKDVAARTGAARAAAEQRLQELRNDREALVLVGSAASADWAKGLDRDFASDPEVARSQLGRWYRHIRENPQLAIYKAQNSAYKYSWMLIPLSVPFLWLMFPFSRRFGLYDHTVFATYSITFMIALIAVASVCFLAGFGGVGALLVLFAPVHMYRQLRGAYALGRGGAMLRLVGLSLSALIVIGLFATIIGWLAGS